MDNFRIGSLATIALIVLAFSGCASGRARTVDCAKHAAPINEHPLVGAPGRPTKPREDAR